MLLRSSTIRSLVILFIGNLLIYLIFSRWTTPSTPDLPLGADPLIYPPVRPRIQRESSPLTLFSHSPMHNELAQLHFNPIR